ncbi:MAG TPA: hypothetical protein VFA92_09930 [Candidatus Binatia bacterium]|nr:hypothetical protein [Candidatus Binatia bacterium]
MPEHNGPPDPYHGAHRRALGKRAFVGLALLVLLLAALVVAIAVRAAG